MQTARAKHKLTVSEAIRAREKNPKQKRNNSKTQNHTIKLKVKVKVTHMESNEKLDNTGKTN